MPVNIEYVCFFSYAKLTLFNEFQSFVAGNNNVNTIV